MSNQIADRYVEIIVSLKIHMLKKNEKNIQMH